MKAASAGDGYGAGRFTENGVLSATAVWVHLRRGLEENIGVRVARLFIQLFGITNLNDAAQVHNDYTVRNVFYNAQVVGDKQHGQIKFVLQINQQIDDLCLD